MIKTENRPPQAMRSLSFTGSSSSSLRSAPLLTRPLALHGEAESVMRKVRTINELSIREEDDEDVFQKPRMPGARNEEEEKKIKTLQRITQKFQLSDAHLLHIENRMVEEINRGLRKSTNAAANIKSFVTYVHDLPTGRESGHFVALDLGGTNFRVILLELEAGSRSVQMKSCKHEVSQKLMLGPATDLFDFLAQGLHDFLQDHGLVGQEIGLGFTFSFPTKQHGLNKAVLVNWTKGFVCAGAEGNDIVKLMQDAIDRKKVLTGVRIDALINDTTGCLLACAYKRPDCAIAVILGTGTNASYVEDMNFVEMYEGEKPERRPAVIINTEWGAFGNTGSLDNVRTEYDFQLDKNSRNPSKQVYEKLISGMYLGELVRLVIVRAVEAGVIFDGVEQKPLLIKENFPTRFLSEIEMDAAYDFTHARAVMSELNIAGASAFDLAVIRYICECVTCRAAELAGAGIASLVNKIGRRRVTIGMDGSLYKFHPHLGRRINQSMKRMVNDSIKFELALSEDGSGRGAALASAVAVKLELKRKRNLEKKMEKNTAQ